MLPDKKKAGAAGTLIEQAATAWGQVDLSKSEEVHNLSLLEVFPINVCSSSETYL